MSEGRLRDRLARIRPELIRTRGVGLLWTKAVIEVYGAPEASEAPSPAPSPAVTVRRAQRTHLHDLLAFDSPDEVEALARLLEEGDEGYLGYVGSECVHRSWLAIGPARVWEHWSRARLLPEGSGYVYYCETSPPARGLGVFPQVLARIAADHPELTLTMAIDSGNMASRRAAEKAGWRHIETVTYSVVAGRRTSERLPARS